MDAIFKGLLISLVFVSGLTLQGCAYTFGVANRSIPGGYKQISVPVFKNKTLEPGIEVGFTNALIQEFQRSRIARVVDNSLSEVAVIGQIDSVTYLPGAKRVAGDGSSPYLPNGTVIASEYRILLTVTVNVVRQADGTVLWSGSFSGERTYAAPQVTQAGINSVNPLYNLSARRQNIDVMANDIMIEAHDRITENF
ncbi:LptE family protein [Bdellovibrio sp. 22V]|uniref:LptE family protein n=1 Tax=Bdellovibrio TaxID=958 RepID=UPI002543C9EC|nr:LptE family protein [Bdellovibrio sp. 22V]WII72052.1 LptE family protein [Bdellovibrio sp. 22V]